MIITPWPDSMSGMITCASRARRGIDATCRRHRPNRPPSDPATGGVTAYHSSQTGRTPTLRAVTDSFETTKITDAGSCDLLSVLVTFADPGRPVGRLASRG